MNYLADCNLIIHESISTGAEIGLFLSEENSVDKTCLIVPEEFAVEEDKIGGFMKGAFLRAERPVKVVRFYPRIIKNIRSDDVSDWHTYFYQNKIGDKLGSQILNFAEMAKESYGVKFTKNKKKVQEGYIHYGKKGKELQITLTPRILAICIAALFNIDEISKEIFNTEGKPLREYVNIIAKWLRIIFVNTMEEKNGDIYSECSIHLLMHVTGVYLTKVIGMCLYLFQAAGFVDIKKEPEYVKNGCVVLSRKMLMNEDGTGSFFYKKYKECIAVALATQIM